MENNVKTILKSSYQKFSDKFGTHYIGKIYTGAVFVCRISGETTNSQDMGKLSATLKAKMASDDISGKVSADDSFNKKTEEMKL